MAQLANYALVGVLAVLVATLLMTVVEAYAVQTAARGRGDPDGRCARPAAGGGAGAADPAAGDADRGAVVGWGRTGEPGRDGGGGGARARCCAQRGFVRGTVGARSGGDRLRKLADVGQCRTQREFDVRRGARESHAAVAQCGEGRVSAMSDRVARALRACDRRVCGGVRSRRLCGVG